MKKKIVMLLAAVMVMGAVFAGCGTKDDGKTQDTSGNAKEETEDEKKEDETEDDSLSYILDKGELVLGMDPAFPPMGFTDEDLNLVGFDVDVATEVCERLGVKLVLQSIDWKAKEQELDTKAIDCIWNGFTLTPSREENHQCSEPYMLNTQVVVVLSDSDMETLDDLAGKTVAIQDQSSAVEAVDNNQDFKNSLGDLITVGDNVQAMLELKQSTSDAVVMDKVVAMYYMEMHPGEYRVLDEYLADEEYVIGFRKDELALCEKVEEILKEMAADGSLAEISTKWFGDDITMIQ